MGAGPAWAQDPVAGKVILGGLRSQCESEHGVKWGQSSAHSNPKGEKAAETQGRIPGSQEVPCTLPLKNEETTGPAEMVGAA